MVAIDADKLELVTDAGGKPRAVVVPIELWRRITDELGHGTLADDPVLQERVRRALASTERFLLDEAKRLAGLGGHRPA
ncbi:MAG: hypothetical protein ACFCVE_03670 [Phycisphaerae bacterium]